MRNLIEAMLLILIVWAAMVSQFVLWVLVVLALLALIGCMAGMSVSVFLITPAMKTPDGIMRIFGRGRRQEIVEAIGPKAANELE